MFDYINSVDEFADKVNNPSESKNYEISPNIEFWGHCSNLQAWAENDYNTTLLHRNIAFSLLKELTIVGDPIAKKVFKEEIAKRIASNYPPVQEFLRVNGYLDFLSKEELSSINFKK